MLHHPASLSHGRTYRDEGISRGRENELIVQELRALQAQFGFLPAEQLDALSKRIDVPISRLHGVASFFPHFRLTPPPKADVRICRDMSCHLQGADRLRTILETQYQNASDQDVTIRGVSRLGQCDHAPAISINDRIFTRANEAGIEQMIRGVLA